MNILIACEFSGTVRDAFTKKGHNTWSCDLIESETPGQHIIDDVLNIMQYPWDMMIAHPPCTLLASSGARWFHSTPERERRQNESIDFFKRLANAKIPKIAIENPIGIMSTYYRKPDQIIQPWQFGHGETKATCLWLKGLSKLQPTNIVPERKHRIHMMSPGPTRGKERSRTYLGIAQAMAEQWG